MWDDDGGNPKDLLEQDGTFLVLSKTLEAAKLPVSDDAVSAAATPEKEGSASVDAGVDGVSQVRTELVGWLVGRGLVGWLVRTGLVGWLIEGWLVGWVLKCLAVCTNGAEHVGKQLWLSEDVLVQSPIGMS